MNSLSSNPSGSGIYGQPKQETDDDVLELVNQLRDREMRDFKDKSNFMSDLSLKQDRIRRIFDAEQQSQNQQQPQMNNVVAKDPNQMTGYEKGQLGIRQQEANIDSQRLSQQGKLGQRALDIKSQQADLAQQKSDQINANKQADMERKINEANQKIQLAQQALEQKTDNAEARLQTNRDLAAAMEERHKLELAQKDHQFQITSEEHKKAMDIAQQKIDQSGESETTTEINADGTKKTVKTTRGSKKRVAVIGPNGESGTIEEGDTLPSGWRIK
jgi:hypothetical protein